MSLKWFYKILATVLLFSGIGALTYIVHWYELIIYLFFFNESQVSERLISNIESTAILMTLLVAYLSLGPIAKFLFEFNFSVYPKSKYLKICYWLTLVTLVVAPAVYFYFEVTRPHNAAHKCEEMLDFKNPNGFIAAEILYGPDPSKWLENCVELELR